MFFKFNDLFPPQSDEELQLNGEGIENCVMKNLYQDLFKNGTEKEFNNTYLKQTLIHQKFLKPEHLDLPTGKNARIDPVRIEHALQQLQQLNKYKTPKAKLTMLINFCRVISIMLQETSLDGQPDGADMFFPSCIYSFLQIDDKSILQDLPTNIQFVKHFRHQDRLSGEDEYYLTTLESIVEFIHSVTLKDLKIAETDYKQMYKKACEDLDNESKAKEEAASVELADLLEMNGASSKDSMVDT
jgi:Rab5 GDP/GTP exchange factor